MNELHLFAGNGGGILGGMLLGHTTVCAVEIDEYPRKAILQRQRDGILPRFPIWDDVRTFDGSHWRGVADIVCGGFPCQDISIAGKGKGLNGERSGLWVEMSRIISEVRPKFAFVENSPMLIKRGLDRVLGDLSEMGYDAEWGVIAANEIGAPHKRSRIWILARDNTKTITLNPYPMCNGLYCTQEMHKQGNVELQHEQKRDTSSICVNVPKYTKWWDVEPGLDRVANGVANRNERIKAIGNGQVPIVAATAFRILYNRLIGC